MAEATVATYHEAREKKRRRGSPYAMTIGKVRFESIGSFRAHPEPARLTLQSGPDATNRLPHRRAMSGSRMRTRSPREHDLKLRRVPGAAVNPSAFHSRHHLAPSPALLLGQHSTVGAPWSPGISRIGKMGDRYPSVLLVVGMSPFARGAQAPLWARVNDLPERWSTRLITVSGRGQIGNRPSDPDLAE